MSTPNTMKNVKSRTRKQQPRRNKSRKTRTGVGPLSYQPKQLSVVFPWVWKGSLTEGAAGLGADQVYRANSLFDPDFTGVGDQPMGYDQWSAFFGLYRVRGCRYTVEIANANTSPCLVGVLPSRNPTLSSSSTSWMSARGVRTHVLGAITGGTNIVKFSGFIQPWDLNDQTRLQYMDDNASLGSTAANPSTVVYLHVFCIGFGTVASVNVMTRLWYNSQLFARNEFNQS